MDYELVKIYLATKTDIEKARRHFFYVKDYRKFFCPWRTCDYAVAQGSGILTMTMNLNGDIITAKPTPEQTSFWMCPLFYVNTHNEYAPKIYTNRPNVYYQHLFTDDNNTRGLYANVQMEFGF